MTVRKVEFKCVLISSGTLTSSCKLTDFHLNFLTSGGDSTEDFSASLDKVLDCMTSSIQIAYPKDILKHQKNLLHVLSSVLSHGFSWTGIYF